ncbi:MAG: DUF2156 domain-containing protein [Spirochaetes bacterium]|jgi:hypothetical protein|nr:DUF2156 domain-containing protein [Spirochaetota bacterium]
MPIPTYPDSAPISLDMHPELHPALSVIEDGISEFTFANLYLFRKSYDYHLSRIGDLLVVSGTKDGKRFFMMPCGLPDDNGVLESLLGSHDYIKGLAERHADANRVRLERMGWHPVEDRDNFDYLYLRSDLAALQGRKYHKKRNLVNAFINNYTYDESPLTPQNISEAFQVLNQWREERTEKDDDYEAAREALELVDSLGLHGYIVHVDGTPAAYTLGEALMKGRSFAVHFEKAIGDYKGIYQFINRAFASVLPRHYHYINREQDLGDEGLRQAKMTYRPFGFVKKYKVVPLGH